MDELIIAADKDCIGFVVEVLSVICDYSDEDLSDIEVIGSVLVDSFQNKRQERNDQRRYAFVKLNISFHLAQPYPSKVNKRPDIGQQ